MCFTFVKKYQIRSNDCLFELKSSYCQFDKKLRCILSKFKFLNTSHIEILSDPISIDLLAWEDVRENDMQYLEGLQKYFLKLNYNNYLNPIII